MIRLMPNVVELETLITRLANDRALLQRGEAATRQGAVNPTLRALGWNTDNLDEVDPEFADSGGGKVDYCLRYRGRDLVLIEVKRAGVDLSQHQEQLLRYAFGLGVELAALTNGLDWWLYLPMKGGRSFEGRRFASIDFRGQDTGEAATALNRFLNRDACISGVTLREAEAEFELQDRLRQVRTILPDAWRRVLVDPQLHELLAREVERIASVQPDPRTLAEFLQTKGGDGQIAPAPSGRSPEPAPSFPPDEAATSGGISGRRLAFWLDGARQEVDDWSAVLPALCEALAETAGPTFADRVVGVTNARGRKRTYFSGSPADLNTPLKLANANVYVEGRVRSNQVEHMARRVLEAIRGPDFDFRIEVGAAHGVAPQPTEPAPSSPSRPTPADLVVALLEEVGAPLHYADIERQLRERGLIEGGGRKPASTLLARFSNDPRLERVGRGTYTLAQRSESALPEVPDGAANPAIAEPERFAGRRLAAFWLDGIRHEVGSWPLMVRTLSEQLMDEAGPTFDERAATVRGRTRRYFSNRPDDLTHPRALANSNLHVEGNLGPDAAVRVARQTLTAVRGNDDGFHIELAE